MVQRAGCHMSIAAPGRQQVGLQKMSPKADTEIRKCDKRRDQNNCEHLPGKFVTRFEVGWVDWARLI